jgi:hypothetical protein
MEIWPMNIKSVLRHDSVFKTLLVFGGFIVLGLFYIAAGRYLLESVSSTRPSARSERFWEKQLYSKVLPNGYSDFRAHWQQQDTGVHIFSFRWPEDSNGEKVLNDLVNHASGFQLYEQAANEVAVRRPNTCWEPQGFDEFRFLSVPATGRVYVMFASLDSERETHPTLVKEFHKISSGVNQ